MSRARFYIGWIAPVGPNAPKIHAKFGVNRTHFHGATIRRRRTGRHFSCHPGFAQTLLQAGVHCFFPKKWFAAPGPNELCGPDS